MYHPNFFYNPHSEYFEESQESHKSDLEILLENFNASQTHSHPNYLSNHQSQCFEESQEYYYSNQTYPQPNFPYNHYTQYFEETQVSYKSDLEILMGNFNEISMMTKRFTETQNATLTQFEESEESHDFNFETSMEDSDATLIHSRLESLTEHFVETQTVQNKEIR